MAGNKCCQGVAENTLFPSTNSRPVNGRELLFPLINIFNLNNYNGLFDKMI